MIQINKIVLKVFQFISMVVISSCIISSPQKYSESKLSKFVELQTREIVQEEISEEFEWLKNEQSKLLNQNRVLQLQIDSLRISEKQVDSVIANDFCFLFFNTSSIKLKNESVNYLNTWMVNKHLNGINQTKYSIIGYSDMSGDSLTNIRLAKDRALYVRNILISEYCISDSLILISSQANMNSCNKGLYRSVKIHATY